MFLDSCRHIRLVCLMSDNDCSTELVCEAVITLGSFAHGRCVCVCLCDTSSIRYTLCDTVSECACVCVASVCVCV